MFFAFLFKKTSGILFFGPSFRKPARKASSGRLTTHLTTTPDVRAPDDAFRAGLRKFGPKNNIPEVFLTRKAKYIYIYIYIYIYTYLHLQYAGL